MPVRGAADHVDVLARQGRGRALRVFDVKRIAAGDVKHALDQAVAYCAAIQFMLKADLSGPLRSLMGFKRDAVRLPALEAVAVVNDTRENRDAIQASARRLADDDVPFKLFALFYHSDDTERLCSLASFQAM